MREDMGDTPKLYCFSAKAAVRPNNMNIIPPAEKANSLKGRGCKTGKLYIYLRVSNAHKTSVRIMYAHALY